MKTLILTMGIGNQYLNRGQYAQERYMNMDREHALMFDFVNWRGTVTSLITQLFTENEMINTIILDGKNLTKEKRRKILSEIEGYDYLTAWYVKDNQTELPSRDEGFDRIEIIEEDEVGNRYMEINTYERK